MQLWKWKIFSNDYSAIIGEEVINVNAEAKSKDKTSYNKIKQSVKHKIFVFYSNFIYYYIIDSC